MEEQFFRLLKEFVEDNKWLVIHDADCSAAKHVRTIKIMLEAYEQLKKENVEQEKMIDEMAQKVSHYVLLEDGINTRPASTEEKIEYFKKKVSEENG